MHSFNDELPKPPWDAPWFKRYLWLFRLFFSELVLQLRHDTPWNLNPPQTFQLPWFPLS